MRPQIVDLSLTLDATPSERVPVRIRYVDHEAGAVEMGRIFGVPPHAFPDGFGWAGEELTLITHAGTHMDAPWHYGPMSQGEPARFIDQVPLEWCFAPGVVLDFRYKRDGEEIRPRDLREAFAQADHQPSPGEIVLLMTGADKYWGEPEYPERGCGLGRAGAFWLLDRGIRIIGIDAWGMDRAFSVMRREYAQANDVRLIWSAHFAGRLREYCQLEKLANLDRLPSSGFRVACFPIKIARAGAGWCRVVAILDGQDCEDAS
jgi:kynurenine formamidase